MHYYPTIGIGDVLARPKLLGIVEHLGVLVDYDAILTNSPERGEHLTTLREFSDNKPVTVHATGVDPSVVAARTHNILSNPQPYDPIRRNCQHTTNEIIHGVAKSPLVAVTALVLVAGIFCLILSRN